MENRPIKFLVVGSTGEYSDYMQWFVGVYNYLEDAEKVKAALIHKLETITDKHTPDIYAWENRQEIQSEMRNFDPKFHLDYTGSNYTIVEVDSPTLEDINLKVSGGYNEQDFQD